MKLETENGYVVYRKSKAAYVSDVRLDSIMFDYIDHKPGECIGWALYKGDKKVIGWNTESEEK